MLVLKKQINDIVLYNDYVSSNKAEINTALYIDNVPAYKHLDDWNQ